MKKRFVLALLLLGLSACTYYKEISVTLPDGTSLQVRMADSFKKQERAWLGQKAPFQNGVLFVFLREEEQTYWRKNTLLDLDVIFLDKNQQITSIQTDVPHRPKYTINAEIPFAFGHGKYLLEVPAGTVQTHGLKTGDTVRFSLP